MLIQTVYTLALHCPYCGKIEMHDISPFTVNGVANLDLLCSCGRIQGRIISANHQQCLLQIMCIVCQTSHIICLDIKKIKHTDMKRICCPQENFELGFIGKCETIAATIANHKHEVESLLQDEYAKTMECEEYDVENSLVMLEVLNKIHDIAENGGLYCRCGSKHIEAEILPDAIQLVCAECHGWTIVPTQEEKDSEQIKSMNYIEINPPQKFYHKH